MRRPYALLVALPLLRRAATLGAMALLAGCSPHAARPPSAAHSAAMPATPPGEGLILGEFEGERRVRRPRPDTTALSTPFIIKVDRRNGGSPDLVMGYEDIAPGQAIHPHHHPHADEIIFVHRGSGVASLGSRSAPVTAGGTIYIPRNTRIAVRNTGTEPLTIVFIFSRPGFEEHMRENSVREGERVTPLTREEQNAIRARHRDHVIYDPP